MYIIVIARGGYGAKKELEMRRNTGDDYFYPAIVVLGDLIDKLNSL